MAATSLPAALSLDATGHVYTDKETPSAHGGVPGASWTLTDWRGRPVDGSGTFGADGTAALPKLPTGYYHLKSGDADATFAVVPVPESRAFDHSSFYGIDEENGVPAEFSVMPNPNNGQMRLNFENLTGKVNIKVYDMRGALIDNFETYNGTSSSSMTYDMSRHANGIYHFVVTGKEGTLSKKVVVQH